jgi:hypothetical protein
LPNRFKNDDGGHLGQVQRTDSCLLGQGEDAFREPRAEFVVNAALFRAKDHDVAGLQVHVPGRVLAAHFDDPGRPAQQVQTPCEGIVEVDPRPGPVIEARTPHLPVRRVELRAAHMQGRPDGRAQPHAGADVAGNGRSVEHHMQTRQGDDVDVCARVWTVRHSIVPSRLLALSLLSAMVFHGCTCGKGDEPPPLRHNDDLVRRRVPDSEMILAVPKGWLIEMPDPGPLPAPPPPGTKIELRTRVLLSARPGTPAPGMMVTPLLLVLEDPWLPVGTTGVDYLVAQRASNQTVIGTNIRHVDAEPSRRQGRPSYHVRDEWNVTGPGGADRVISQEALLILDDAIAPDGSTGVHGYTVVITLEKGEFERMQPLVREILASVVFEAKAPAADAGVAGPTPPR